MVLVLWSPPNHTPIKGSDREKSNRITPAYLHSHSLIAMQTLSSSWMKESMSRIWEPQFPIPIMMREDEDTGSNVMTFKKHADRWTNEDNRPLVTDGAGWVGEMCVWRPRFEDESLMVFDESTEYTSNFYKQNRKITHNMHVISWTWKP